MAPWTRKSKFTPVPAAPVQPRQKTMKGEQYNQRMFYTPPKHKALLAQDL